MHWKVTYGGMENNLLYYVQMYRLYMALEFLDQSPKIECPINVFGLEHLSY